MRLALLDPLELPELLVPLAPSAPLARVEIVERQ